MLLIITLFVVLFIITGAISGLMSSHKIRVLNQALVSVREEQEKYGLFMLQLSRQIEAKGDVDV